MDSLFELPGRALSTAVGLARGVDDLRRLLDAPASSPIVAHSPRLLAVLDQATRFARSSATVLITGESGTGKELVARHVHELSKFAAGPYVRVNCAALSEQLVESELFGHERGAFTGAETARVGRIEWAAEGTLLLDEISEISPITQAKLLRVLEEGEFQRVGSNETRQVKARIVATSNRRLEDEVAAGRFRADLFYRLNVLQLAIPALRERREDILPLTASFIQRHQAERDMPVVDATPAAVRRLLEYDWPGNVRQLRNVVQRACVLCAGEQLDAADLSGIEGATPVMSSNVASGSVAAAAIPPTSSDWTAWTLDEAEQNLIKAALERNQGNASAAARDLGVTPRVLRAKVRGPVAARAA